MRYDLSVPTSRTATISVKKKRLPPWITPKVAVLSCSGLLIAVMAVLPLVRETRPSVLPGVLIVLGLALPQLGFATHRLLTKGAPRGRVPFSTSTLGGTIGGGWIYRVLAGGVIGTITGLVLYLQYITIL